MKRKPRVKTKKSGASADTSSRRIARVLILSSLVVAAIVVGSRLLEPGPLEPVDPVRQAVVVDQLSPEDSNPTLRSAVRISLEQFGLDVTEYEGGEVTVETYRSLGSDQPAVLVVRSHSGVLSLQGDEEQHITALFTNEPYSRTKHLSEQLQDKVLIVRRHEQDENLRFGVSPLFIAQSMRDSLPRTVVIIAGCSCLGRTDLAEAFRARGASAVISWDGPVSLDYLDSATEHLVDCLFDKRMTIEDATVSTMLEYGSDPEFGAILLYYPPAAGRYTVEDLIS